MRFLLYICIIASWFIIFMSKQSNFFFKFYMFYEIFLFYYYYTEIMTKS